MKDFGKRVKKLRLERKITKEDFCCDGAELSIRQLTRIESGQSFPTLPKAKYIAQRLGVTLDYLTDGEKLSLPQRYKELKYLLLRTSTFGSHKRLMERENYFDEIFTYFYESLPDEEQLVIEVLQSKLDIHYTENIDFGVGLLNDCFDQILLKTTYDVNDLVIIDLYFSCIIVSDFDLSIFDLEKYNQLMTVLLMQESYLSLEDLPILNNVLLNNFEILFKIQQYDTIRKVITLANHIMARTQNFQKKPIVNILEWKYSLIAEQDQDKAEEIYNTAVLYAQLTGNHFLEERLNAQWQDDFQKRT
ncbi:helix-turn-helix domain-containing protein [Streptococcus macacae]|uniref:DNA-binding helix-turn-helix protein n=1 Tax=Streptococcus macacae NCTC 11558 TaxID=764298 RepID=G5JXQ3_9STRE|nr:XRE family transcriptional regulator [Streptococcus macacae]EHJ53226.1 DNA-binding helix-turn-helix protein [Streptococcus macacae NCTC 11558]SUN77610.1 transcriptional regulator [Streptococcus macacae NCTC 11558]